MPKYYKFLQSNDTGPHSGFDEYSLPKGKRPGKWMKIKGKLVECHRGWHVTTRQSLRSWYSPGFKLYEVEIRKDVDRLDKNKTIAREMRFLKFIGYVPLGARSIVEAQVFSKYGITEYNDGYNSKFGVALLKLVKETQEKPSYV